MRCKGIGEWDAGKQVTLSKFTTLVSGLATVLLKIPRENIGREIAGMGVRYEVKGIRRKSMSNLVPVERIENKILMIRGQKVMLDNDLAELYETKTFALNQAVKRNADRFPKDFMFQLTGDEWQNLKFQTGISNLKSQIVISSWGGRRKLPFAFTEQGVAMLSSVLRSKRAVQVNIMIMRAFVRIRHILATHKELRDKIEQMEKKYDKQFAVVFEYIKSFLDKGDETKTKKIGFLK